MVSHLKNDLMQKLIAEISLCSKCSLWKTRKNPVPGEGDINALVVFIGEAPGRWEDVEGKPFVGPAGDLLNRILRKIGLSRGDIYITNLVKCRPPSNRDPHLNEIESCSPYLDRVLDIIKPKIILTLGRHSTSYMFSKVGLTFRSISEVQGKIYEVKLWGSKIHLIASYHPAAAFYNMELEKEIETSIKLVKDSINRVIRES
ncbi:uracil-DNA glycosylase [Candidatus Bathyarchaeota archaeon]|nr:uracil-DNA glycosylase [Candidatus Bathyarchaeota archaeon]